MGRNQTNIAALQASDGDGSHSSLLVSKNADTQFRRLEWDYISNFSSRDIGSFFFLYFFFFGVFVSLLIFKAFCRLFLCQYIYIFFFKR